VWGLARVAGTDRLALAHRHGRDIVVTPADLSRSKDEDRAGLKVTMPIGDVSLRHDRLDLPEMSRDRMAQAVQSHFSTVRGVGERIEFGFTADRPKLSPTDVLAVSVAADALSQAIGDAEHRGYRVERAVTPATAMSALLKSVAKYDTEPSRATIAVHLGDCTGSVALLLGHSLRRSREFVMPSTGSETLRAGDHDAVAEEITQAIRYFEHTSRRPIGELLLSSDLDGVEPLVPICHERFGVPARLLVDAIEIDPSGFGGGDKGRRTAITWLLAMACAVQRLQLWPDIDLQPQRGPYWGRRRQASSSILRSQY
jgi:hypothetical protein